ncbi:MAG: hypothetical protein K9N46_15200 [Candidatus Marinimicrobia bacterium]|nr:hypothetical protein [Candidatus Neomarinimicrobiota bacterium]MCF7830187.1 hypothetical protein [Candidatus Neomarinimicrobiota bacterium]MCF7882079.1 hypothetical protein [Candidatus Neomarinimicrobiota bacterium]
MRKIIQGKLYDTETAEILNTWTNRKPEADSDFRRKTLYRTHKGNLFLHLETGSSSNLEFDEKDTVEDDIEPIDELTAVEFLEVHDGTEVIIQQFPDFFDEA